MSLMVVCRMGEQKSERSVRRQAQLSRGFYGGRGGSPDVAKNKQNGAGFGDILRWKLM